MSDAGARASAAPESARPAGARDNAARRVDPRAGAAGTAGTAGNGRDTAPEPHAGPPVELAWSVHPAARSPARAALVGLLVLGAALLTGAAGGSLVFAALALAFLGWSLRAFFLPRHYRLDASGAAESGPLCAPRALAWVHVKQLTPARFGVWLGERHNPSRLLPARGLFLRTQGNRAAVLAAARAAVEAAAAPADDTGSPTADDAARASDAAPAADDASRASAA